MASPTARELADETFARWQYFYKKGMISRRTLVKAAMVWAGAGSFGAIMAGCGEDEDDAPAAPGTTPMATDDDDDDDDVATPVPDDDDDDDDAANGGLIRLAFESDLPTMDPHMHLLRTGIITFYHTHDNLGVRDLETNLIAPWLAESWEILEPTLWEMKLREGVMFHNGDPFTAETVKWNWERIIDPEQASPQIGNHAAIAGVDVIDDYTVQVHTTEPYPIFTERLQNFQLIPEKLAQEMGDEWLAENAVGTGPYKFVEWRRGDQIVMERNDDYWHPDVRPAYKDFIIRIIPGIPTQLAELLAGNVEIVRVVPFDQMPTVDASGVATTRTQAILRTSFIGLDAKGRTSENPYQDVRVRHAANHACDIEGYIANLQPGGDRAPACLNPMHFGFDESIEPHEYDPELARQLLAEAGYEDGFEATWHRGPSSMPNQDQVDQAIQRDLEAVGIRARFDTVADTNVSVARVTEGHAGPMWNWNWGSYSVFDADGIYWDMFHPSTIYNYWENDEFTEAIEEARGSMDADHRQELYSRAQRVIRDEAPIIFQWGFHSVWGVNDNVDWMPAVDEIDRIFTAKPKS
jgi:peptide/nickel transport system substrate-binding protein